MFNKMIHFSLQNRLLVVAGVALLFVYGVFVVTRLPVDVLPDMNRPTVTVLVETSGLAPEEVETLVTFPIETTLNGAPGVTRVRSSSAVGFAVVWVEFDWGTDIYINRQIVNERLQIAKGRLPEGVETVMGPISSIMGEILLIGMRSETGKTPPMEIRTLADWVVRQRLLTISGVAQVIPIGGEVKQYQVLVSPPRLARLGISLSEVEQAVAEAQKNTTGGFLENPNKEFLIRNLGRTSELSEIANTVITNRDHVPILVKDVAQVQFGPRIKRGDASVDGSPAVILSVQKQPGANTLALTREIEEALREIQGTLPQDIKLVSLFKQANFIEAAVANVEEALRDGAIMVTIILFLFLLNFRTTFITLTAIPLSFIITAIVFKYFGITINTMTLGGLAVAIGELTDDAIVDVENVFRRLKENRHKPDPENVLKVIYHASLEIRSSIVYATALVVLVFIPLFALSGIEGRLFAPFGIAYITSITASLFVSLTVTPALCSYLLPKSKVMEKEEYGSRFVQALKSLDRKLLHFTLRHASLVMAGAGLLFVVAVATVPFLGREFLPEFNEGTATISLLTVPGTSLEESSRIGTQAERLLMQVPEVASVGRRTGRAELDEHAEGVHSSEIDVDLKSSKRHRSEILQDIRSRLAGLPGVVVNVGQPISHRLDHLLSGVRAQIAVKIFGTDLDLLRRKAQEVEGVMRTVPGVVDLQTEKQVLIPQVKIKIKREEAARFGIKTGELAELLETAFNGKVVSEVLDGVRTFDILVRYEPEARNNLAAFEDALIDTPTGGKVRLGTIAKIEESLGPNVINRENVQRRIVVMANVAERDLGAVIEEIQQKVATRVSFPPGFFITYGGQFESQQAATRMIGLLGLFSVAAMFLVLYTHFKSARIVLQILINIPLAFIGGMIATFLTGRVLSVASLVGFIACIGIVNRNTIMMISHYIHLIKEEGERFDEKMIVRGSLERLVPVLMTALTAGLALIPLVLAKGEPGKEILYPVATVILGGIVVSTLLDMALTPAVFYKFGGPAVKKFLKEEEKKIDTVEERDGHEEVMVLPPLEEKGERI
jgi:CzcA family heavy metal efflux pump